MKTIKKEEVGEKDFFTVDYFDDEDGYKRESLVDYSEMVRLKTNYGFGTKIFVHRHGEMILVGN